MKTHSFGHLSWLGVVAVVLRLEVVSASDWEVGDLFLGLGNGQYEVRENDGTFKEIISTNLGSQATGCAFNIDSTKLYTTSFSAGKVVVFDADDPHPVLAPTIDTSLDGDALPESIVFDSSGNFYVGHAGGTKDIRKYDSDGNFLQSFNVQVGPRGSDWIELASDQRTMYYTSEGRTIFKYDVVSDTQLGIFATAPGSGNLYALRLLPPGNGLGGLLVADSNDIKRFDGSGAVVQTYPIMFLLDSGYGSL
jgi:hypothetical protein